MSRNLHHPLTAGDFALALNSQGGFEAGRFIDQAKAATGIWLASKGLRIVGDFYMPSAAASDVGTPASMVLVLVECKNGHGAVPECVETTSLILPAEYSTSIKTAEIWLYLQARTLGAKGKTPIANGAVNFEPRFWWWARRNCAIVMCGDIHD